MMKWIVGLLVLANVLFFGWMRWGSMLTVDADAVTAQAALNQDKIRLLELSPASAVAPATKTMSGVSLTLSPLPAPASAVTPTPVAQAEQSEQPTALNCAEWGEFSGTDLVRAQQSLAALSLGEKLAQHTVERNHGYWVYIPPLKKRSQVENKIAQLKERGVEDYFVVQEKGKWLNAISLGIFKSDEAAQKFLATLKNKGVHSAKVGERVSKLKYVVFTIKNLDAAMTARLSAIQKDFPDSELKVSTCGN